MDNCLLMMNDMVDEERVFWWNRFSLLVRLCALIRPTVYAGYLPKTQGPPTINQSTESEERREYFMN